MSKQGKRLLIIAAASMAIIFAALYILSGITGGTSHRAPIAPGTSSQRTTASDIALSDDTHEGYHRPLPAISLSRRLQEIASNKYISNRLSEAIDLWELSVYLNASNVLSQRRLGDVKQQLDQLVEEIIALGNYDYKFLRFKRAIYHWEKVLNLIHDKNSPAYKKTSIKIEMARKKLRK